MRVTEQQAKKMWCPFVRVEGSNRVFNTKTSGFDAEHLYQHCIGSKCMGWRPFIYSHVKGGDEAFEHHGYCGLAGRPEMGD
jgi:hypothetical protein